MLDHRGKDKVYYYRHVRINGRPVRVYVGTGPDAEKAAAEDAKRIAERRACEEQRQATEAAWDSTREALDKLGTSLDLLTSAVLVAAGFYRHDRGLWRRRRNGREETGTGD